MDNKSHSAGSAPAIMYGLLGAAIGVATSPRYPRVGWGAFLLYGFWVGLWIGTVILRLQEGSLTAHVPKFWERREKEPREHFHLRKELRDSYYEDAVMRLIEEIYHPENAHAQDEEQDSEGKEEDCGRVDDRFAWPDEFSRTADDEEADLEGQVEHPAHSGRQR